MRDPERTKEAILTAAERFVAEKGIQALTLDEVAAGASVSKGGLLHHFPNKHALIGGLAERMLRLYDEEVEEYRAKDASEPGSYTRALLRANLACADECTQVCAALMAAIQTFPGSRELFRKHSAKCQKRIEADGLDPVAASVVRYAAEGLMSAALWGMPRPSNYDKVVRHLLQLAGAPRGKTGLR